MKTLKVILLLLLSYTVNAENGVTGNNSKNYVSLELDPAPFILGGYSFSLKYSPKQMKHVTFMGSVYSSNFPDKMMSKSNYEKGFRDLKIKTSYAFFADYFFKENRTGLHFGPSVFYYSKSVKNNSTDDLTNFKSIYPNIRLGYVYKPFRNSGFYLNPWLNFGKEIVSSGKNKINNKEFLNEKFSYIIAIHFGYQLTF